MEKEEDISDKSKEILRIEEVKKRANQEQDKTLRKINNRRMTMIVGFFGKLFGFSTN